MWAIELWVILFCTFKVNFFLIKLIDFVTKDVTMKEKPTKVSNFTNDLFGS